MNEYPQCDKLLAVKDKSQVIGEFLEWLQGEKNLVIAEWDYGDSNTDEDPLVRHRFNIQELLAEFFEIDLVKVEEERRAILDEQRRLNEKPLPFFAIGNDELEKAPAIKKGDTIMCPLCKGLHVLEHGKTPEGHESDLLLFYKCGDSSYLAGIKGKRIR